MASDVTRPLIGLTGGVGSGKSTVSKMFSDLGATIIDTDRVAREVVPPGSEPLKHIKDLWGDDALLPDGHLNRAFVREKVSGNDRALTQLESIMHPPIRKQVQALIQEASGPYIILVVPLLLEKGRFYPVNRVLVTDCPEPLQLEGAHERDGHPAQTIKAIMDQQLSRQSRLAQADDVIDTDADIPEVRKSVKALHDSYCQLA